MWDVLGAESMLLLAGRCPHAKSGDRFLFIQCVTEKSSHKDPSLPTQ